MHFIQITLLSLAVSFYADAAPTPNFKLRCNPPKNEIEPFNFWSNPRYKWPRGVLPYVLSPLYSLTELSVIRNAIAEWEQKTCVRFVQRTTEVDYVEITPNDGTSSYCYSYVGRQGGRQYMKMFGECLRHAAMIHELGHAIGFNHEHQRPDRDNYIVVHYQNIQPEYHYAFVKYTYAEVDNMGTPYDYSSVMQYPYYAFTDYDPARPAMTLPNGSIDAIRNEAQFLSTVDVQKTHVYYNNCA